MSTVSATGITDLMQLLATSAPSALSSLFSSSSMKAALGKESPADIVNLSEQAMQLQEADGLFGGPPAPTVESSGMQMQDILTSAYTGATVNSAASPVVNPAEQLQNVLTSMYTGSTVNLLG